MAKEKTINIDGVHVLLLKSSRSKRMSISIKPFVGVRVSVPRLTPFWMAERFAKSRIDWVKENLSKVKTVEDQQTIFTEKTEFKTFTHSLEIRYSEIEQLKVRVNSDVISVLCPKNVNLSDDSIQQEIRKGIECALRKEAKAYLPSRIKELADSNNLEYNNVAIKNTKTRWGSCSHQNNINLNLQLMRLPNHLIDYVILHELAHTIVKNHSRDFWNYLDSICPNSKVLDREMKQYNTRIY